MQIYSLQSICLDFVAEHLCHYQLSQLAELPHSILSLLVKYLSTTGLLILDDLFCTKGISTDEEWQTRVQRQCPYRFQRPVSLFYDKFRGRRDARRPRNVFMERHFRSIIEKIGTDACSPSSALNARPYMINPGTRNRCCKLATSQRTFSCLLDVAVAVEILTVNASNGLQLSALLDISLTKILQRVTRRLDFHFISRASVDQSVRLAQLLILHGQVTEVSFFQSNLAHFDIIELFKVFSARRLQDTGNSPDVNPVDTADSDGSSTGGVDEVQEEEIGEDLFDLALTPQCYSSEGVYLYSGDAKVGIDALSIVNCSLDELEFNELLGISLRLWSELKKLAIVGTTNDTSKYEKPLCDAVQKGWLTHLVLDNCGFAVNFLSHLLSAILFRVGSPLEQLTLLFPENYPIRLGDSLLSDLSHNQFGLTDDNSGDDLRFIQIWIRNDSALKHLLLKQFDAPLLIHEILDSIRERGHLESLNLQGVSLTQYAHQDCLVEILRSTPTLEKLNVKECSLPADFVVRADFIDVVTKHPNLVNLNVAANRLEKCACTLLKAIYAAKACGNGARFQKLNISFNRISSKSLMSVASELAEIRSSSHPAITKLDISGNVFGDHRSEILLKFEISISKVVGLTIDFASEHLSQM